MPPTSLAVSHPILQEEIAAFLGWGRTPASWAADQIVVLNRCIESGLRQFYFPLADQKGIAHEWSFMRPVSTLTTTAPYTTGTITVVLGVVTLAGVGAVWPAWAAEGELQVSDDAWLVTTRDSNTQLTLTDLTVAVAAGTHYSLGRPAYDLPADFSPPLEGPMTYRPGASQLYPPIETVRESTIRANKQDYNFSGHPSLIALRPKAFDPLTGQRWQALFCPTPDGAYQLGYAYRVIPTMLDATNLYPFGSVEHAETIIESCLAIAEERYNDEIRVHRDKFPLLLAASIAADARNSAPEFLGYNRDRSDRYPSDVVHSFNGVIYYD